MSKPHNNKCAKCATEDLTTADFYYHASGYQYAWCKTCHVARTNSKTYGPPIAYTVEVAGRLYIGSTTRRLPNRMHRHRSSNSQLYKLLIKTSEAKVTTYQMATLKDARRLEAELIRLHRELGTDLINCRQPWATGDLDQLLQQADVSTSAHPFH
jgi:predicted GIY-YIG superfamily endonuclease